MDYLSVEEKIEIILIYGECRRNVNDAVSLYAERFPHRVRSRASFFRVIKQFTTEGSVQPKKRTRKATVTGENNEIAVLAAVANNPNVSTREIARDCALSHELHGDDFHNRVTFCQWALERIRRNPDFFRRVLFSDESTFTNHGAVNRHNMHYWSMENPQWLRQVEHQRPWSVNVWCGIIGDKLIGPYFIEGTLNGEKYRNILQNELPTLLEDLSLEERRNMWFQHDGCPAHNSVVAREVLNRDYNGRWIGRGGPVHWPVRSPDLTSLDFFLWGLLKTKVYQQMPTTLQNMIGRIRNACAQIEADTLLSYVQSFEVRINKCIEVEGQQFEHLLN